MADQHPVICMQKSEIWSCGVILFQLIYGKLPLRRKEILNATEVSIPLTHRIDIRDDQVSNDCKDLVRKMLDINPATRISLQEILGHPWYLVALPSGCQGWIGDVDW